MKRANRWIVSTLALGTLAMGQEPDPKRVEVQIVRPDRDAEIVEIEELAPDLAIKAQAVDAERAARTFILGSQPQDADDAKKRDGEARKKQDERTIVKELDLGDGRTLKIVISTDGKDGEWKARRPATIAEAARAPLVRMFRGEMLDPHGFDVAHIHDDFREHMERAMRAFDRAREEFMRALEEHGSAEGHAPHVVVRPRAPQAPRAPRAPQPEAAPKEKRGGFGVFEIKPGEEGARRDAREKTSEESFVERRALMAIQDDREIDKLRKEVEELRAAIKALKKELAKQGDKDDDKDE